VLFVDYGLVRREYYHPQRSSGTLICHYRHRAHADPFLYPGLQDITAWVDFSACAAAARRAGLTVAGFTTQAQFLLATLAAEPPRVATDGASLRELSAMKTLVLPGEMGERFKVLALRTGDARGEPLPGRDFRDRL
jgi:SAM-dependent MidA family methyltransferase